MTMAEPPSCGSFLPLLKLLEDSVAGQSEQTDAYLTIASRLSGEEARKFLPAVEHYFARLGKATLDHITSPNVELSQAALQALGFCVYHSRVVSGVSETFASEILSALCSLVVKSTDKNTCTRALWVISKQSFPSDMVAKKVPSILDTLESIWSREDIQSVVMEHEALNVIIRMLEQVPTQMGDAAEQWVKLVIPLVVHSASKVRLRAAATLEMGMPLLLEKQTEVAAIIEPMMSLKLIPELQKLFTSKNETNVLKLWPLFVKLLGKLLHKGGPFINSLLHLEELGFRSSSPSIKKMTFIAWKSLIDNFALNPEILCSSKRMKLLMQPLTSINVRTEVLMLTKVEVWWYLVVQLGPNLSLYFEQVSVPLLKCTIGSDSASVPGTPSRTVSQNGATIPGTPGFNSPSNMARMSLNSSIQIPSIFPTIQLLGLEMLLHYFLGPEITAKAAKNNFTLSLEPLNHQLLSSASSFTKHATVLTSYIKHGLINIGKDAPESLLDTLWTSLVHFVNITIESVGSKKERYGCEPLTLMLQALQSIVTSEAMPVDKVLILIKATVEGIPQRVLGSASYQVGKMDVLNGTPALFLIVLLYKSNLLEAYIEDKRFFQCLQTLVSCGLSGPTSHLAFAEAVLGAFNRSAGSLQNKEQLWVMWNTVVCPLTDTIMKSNEVNQGDALEHNFSSIYAALLFPIIHLLCSTPLQQGTQKLMLTTWSKLYRVFARCSALVITAEENICCEELCTKLTATIERKTLMVPSTLAAIVNILQVIVECVDFSPYTPLFQQKLKSPHTPVNWMPKRNKVLGNLTTFQCLLVQCLEVYLDGLHTSSEATGMALISILSTLFTNFTLTNIVKEALTSLIQPLALFYKQANNELPSFTSQFLEKLEKLLGDILSCLQTCTALVYDDELLVLLSPLLVVLFPHKHKQLHTLVNQFWNSTFANSVTLIYPNEIRPILIQVKQKTPIILPGFDLVSMPDELNGQCLSESSQLETKLSGTSVSSMGGKNSLLAKASELKEKSSIKTSKLVSAKLDFGSPKPPRREVLEEEASIDFVFIPPETKERVLTEHQKEVKRTKRFDIPAMYNSLDASLDTTVFTKYSQSQPDYLDNSPTEQPKAIGGTLDKVHQEDMENIEDDEIDIKMTQNYASLMTADNKKNDQDMISEPAGVSVEDVKSDERVEDVGFQYKKETSPNISCSSKLISGTPQKSNSRRQSFITLEKYSGGKTTNLGQEQITNCQEKTEKYSSLVSPTLIGPNSKDSLHMQTKGNFLCSGNYALKSPLKEFRTECKPVKLTERMPNDAKDVSALKDFNPSCQEEESHLGNSQSPMTQTPGEPRRSGRYRVKPLCPGEDTEVREEKCIDFKRRHSREELKGNFPKPSIVQNGPKTRSRQADEEDSGKDRLRTRAQRNQSESSQKKSRGQSHKIKRYSSSGQILDNLEPKNRSIRESSQSDSRPAIQSDSKSKSKGRPSRCSKASLTTKEDNEIKNNVLVANEDTRQTITLEFTEHTNENNEPKKDAQLITSSPQTSNTQEFNFTEQTENCNEKPKRDSQTTTCSDEIGWSCQEFEDYQKVIHENDSITSPSNDNSLHMSSLKKRLINESAFKDKEKTIEGANENISQDDSELTYSSSDGQTLRRSRRKKLLSEAVGSEEKGKNKASLERRSRSNSQSIMLGFCHIETTCGDATRTNKAQEVKTPSLTSSPLSSQEIAGSVELSQGKGRYSRRRSSQAIVTNVGSSESECSEPRENLPRQRGRKRQSSLHSPLILKSPDKLNNEIVMHDYSSCETNAQSIEKKDAMKSNDSPKTQDLRDSGLFKLTQNSEGQSTEDSHPDIELAKVLDKTDTIKNKSNMYDGSLQEEKKSQSDINNTVLHEADTRDIQEAKKFESVGIIAEGTKGCPCDLSLSDDGIVSSYSIETTESLHSSDEKTDVSELSDTVAEKQNINLHYQEYPVVPIEVSVVVSQNSSLEEKEIECLNALDDFSKEEEPLTSIKEDNAQNQHAEASDKLTPLQETNKDGVSPTVDCQGDNETWTTSTEKDLDAKLSVCYTPVLPESMCKQAIQGSPLRQVDQDSVIGSDVIQSPCSNKTRGTWSPLASPSTSILKKSQKRPLEDETPSPIVKSRRVSFADPIQQQEIADDIDRRSPIIRTSSPRRTINSNVPQPKYVTTPTKRLLILRPRNLHSPGYKSSKKCLISEMSQEQRPAYKDCIYPPLVGCPAPVEAVLPQISSNIWSRGFGQLIRARNIKTVGDISALTPSEIKTLPFRSPKISNVKKALKTYEQQRKGQVVDELKSIDDTEVITSELARVPQNKDEEDKTSGRTQEPVDEPVPIDWRLEQDGNSVNETVNQLAGEQRPKGHSEGLLPELETLTYRMTPLQLSYCSAEQLVQMYDTLGSMMKSVVVELQTRLCQTDGKP